MNVRHRQYSVPEIHAKQKVVVQTAAFTDECLTARYKLLTLIISVEIPYYYL